VTIPRHLPSDGEKPLTQAISKINKFEERIDLKDNVRKHAKFIYKQFETKKPHKIRGSNSDAMILAVLYLA